jgi:hypothetical protein
MSAPKVRGGGSNQTAPPQSPRVVADITQPNDTPEVWATTAAPCGNRGRWAFFVPCDCGGVHIHYGSANGGVRRRGCDGRSYIVRPRPGVVQ